MAGREGLMCEDEWCKYEGIEYKDGVLYTKYMCKGNCDFADVDIESFKRGKESGVALMQKKIIERLSDESMKKIICEIANDVLNGGEE